MEIAAFNSMMLIDYPGKIAAAVFTQGCNRRCCYCHNRELLTYGPGRFSWGWVADRIRAISGFIDAVVFTGGEPTLHPDLPEKIMWIKTRHSLAVGLHSNGDGPSFVEAAPLCDYVLLSHATPEKLAVANKASRVDVFGKDRIDWELTIWAEM